MAISERDLLDEIHDIIRNRDIHGSRQQGKNFYDSGKLPELLVQYRNAAGKSWPEFAAMMGMSAKTLRAISNGGPLSENMLFRIRNTMEYAYQHPGISIQKEDDTFPGDWKDTRTKSIQAAIATVAEKLIFLKNAVLESNSVGRPGSPVDEIQVAQLIALLEATIAALKAPYVEPKQTSGFIQWLKKLGKSGVEKGLEGKVKEAIDGVVDAGGDLLGKLADASGPSDLGGMIT